MIPLFFGRRGNALRVLCVGAHSDDIEIGCAGLMRRLIGECRRVEVTWAVLCAVEEREREARASAQALLKGAARTQMVFGDLRDSHFPAEFARAKEIVGSLRKCLNPDLILTHRLEDRHQDHRLVAELTWQTWRNHLILEYEIPKYEGDLGQPNLYVTLPAALARRKIAHLMKRFGSQRSKAWFTPQTFASLMHLRGVESRAASGFAEGFCARKLVL